jgi:aspartate carbamoyltransferase catalytic subunit
MFKGRDVISILEFSRAELEKIFRVALRMEKSGKQELSLLRGKLRHHSF